MDLVSIHLGKNSAYTYAYISQLGVDDYAVRTSPSPVSFNFSGSNTIGSISAGGNHVICCTKTGRLLSWGYNKYGQLGLGNTNNSAVPMLIQNIHEFFVSASAGQRHSLFLTNTGKVYSCGHNQYGTLGQADNNDVWHPSLIHFPSLDGVIKQVFSGGYHSLFLVEKDGNSHLWSVGYNATGELGIGTTTSTHKPIPIPKLENVVQVAAGSQHTLVKVQNGSIYGWGYNKFG